jgi:hypothetical protein
MKESVIAKYSVFVVMGSWNEYLFLSVVGMSISIIYKVNYTNSPCGLGRVTTLGTNFSL